MISSVEIFFCYARKDKELLEELQKQLRPLERRKLVRPWHDREISAGADWEKEISTHLDTAQIILLLVSPDFLASDYCYGVEVERAMERHERGEARVIPIILRPVYWQAAPFGKLQALPTDGKPVNSPAWHSPDEAFNNISEGVRKAVQQALSMQWVTAGKEHVKDKRYEEALAAYEKAIEHDENYTPAYQEKGDVLYELCRYEEALTTYRQARSNDISLLMRQGQTLVHLRRYEEALAAYEECIRLYPKDALAYAKKGYVLSLLTRYEEALTACSQALRLDANSAFATYVKSSILAKLQRHQEVAEAYKQAESMKLDDASSYQAKGDALCNLTRYEEALTAYKDALELAPRNPLLHQSQGNALMQLAEYEKALSAYEQAISLNPHDATTYHHKALVLERLAQQAHAEAGQRGYSDDETASTMHSLTTSRAVLSATTLDDITLIHTLEGHTAEAVATAINPDGQFLASVGEKEGIKMWNLHMGTLISEASVYAIMPFVTFSCDSYLVISTFNYDSSNRGFLLYNPYTVESLNGLPSSSIGTAGAVSPDGQIFIGGHNGNLARWNLHNGKKLDFISNSLPFA